MTIEERVAALEAEVEAMQRAVDKSEHTLGERLNAMNEIREAMRDQSRNFVSRGEFQWAIGALLLGLLGLLARLLIR